MLTKSFRHHIQVAFNGPKSDLPHIHRKCGKHSVEISAVLDPCGYPRYGKGVPEVEQAGLRFGSISSHDPSDASKFAEIASEASCCDGSSHPVCKQMFSLSTSPVTPAQKFSEQNPKVVTDRNLSEPTILQVVELN